MTKTGRLAGCLMVAVGLWQTALAASDGVPTMTPVQMLDLANKALAAGNLSSQDRARILVRRSLAREMLGQRAEALVGFNEAISSSALGAEEQANALYDRGVTLDELNRSEDAIADYTAALKLSPRLAPALNNRANALRRLGRFAEAERDYEASIAAGNPHPEYPHYGMGQIAEALGQPMAAREYYRSALAANPQFTLASDRLSALGAGADTSLPDPPIVLTKPVPVSRQVVRPHLKATAVDTAAPELKPAIDDSGVQGRQSVQLGAWRSEAEARDAWSRFEQKARDVLVSFTPRIVAVDLTGKGRWYRLRVGKLDASGAVQLCNSLHARGIACILTAD